MPQTKATDLSRKFGQLITRGEAAYFHKNPDHITFDFDQGTPDPELFPLTDLLRIAGEVTAREGAASFDYFDKRYGYKAMFLGWDPLREQIASYVGQHSGRTPDIDDIIVVNGSAQGIALAANLFLDANDAVFVEAATFPYALKYFQQAGARVFPVEVDADGLDPDALARQLQRARSEGAPPKLVYLIPTGQLPTGTVMPLERRRRILDLASEWDLVIIEDNIYAPFQYDGDPVPSLWSLDTEGRVLQSDAFSKTIGPATRIGWMTSNSVVAEGMARVRQDIGTSLWLMEILAQYLGEGLLEPHIAQSLGVYRAKRDAVEAALTASCRDLVSWTPPKAAFYYWMRLSDGVDWEYVRQEMFDAGVAMRPGERFLGDAGDGKFLRMAFVHLPTETAVSGIRLFGDILARAQSRR